MDARKQVDTNGLSFMRLIEGRYYYVDKTLLVKDLLDHNAEGVYLYTRPRRFGKSTNISMLDAFFNREYRGNTWFDGLLISDHPECDVHKNAYPVIRINLKSLYTSGSEYSFFLDKMASTLQDTFRNFAYLLDSEKLLDSDKDLIRDILSVRAREGFMQTCILKLCKFLEIHHGVKAVVLIDEYDSAVTRSMDDREVQKRIIGFLGEFMSSTLKNNDSLRMGYVTGVMQIAKAQMFSDVNNLTVNNIFSEMSEERFGFTESEVRKILNYYGKDDRFDEVREWYDGYRFGNAEVYNPFSVMSYVSNGFKPEDYWIDNTNNLAVEWLVDRVDLDTLGERANLVNGKEVIVDHIQASLTYDDLDGSGREELYSLMAMTGYLNAIPREGGGYTLAIPNSEVIRSVEKLLGKKIRISGERSATFARAVLDGDAAVMTSMLADILTNSSYFVLKDESSYENIVLALLHGMLGGYTVNQELEAGNGRADLILKPDFPGGVPVIMEFKDERSECDLEASAEDAIAQIHSRKYYMGMHGKVVIIGLAFHVKTPCAKTEILDLRSV